MQQPLSVAVRIGVKAFVLFLGWLIASLAGVIAIALWVSYGGHVHWPEMAAILLGHALNAGLTIALATAAASIAEHPATAAILTLAFTVGTWVVSFVAAVQGGVWERLSSYTPPVMVAEFQHGLVQLDVVLIATTLVLTGLSLAAVWMRIGVSVSHRVVESMAVIGFAAILSGASSFATASWDASENRYNSFSLADEETLARIRKPLVVEVHLAPEDPRRHDLERHAISKLRRVLPNFTVHYVSATSTGIFEQTADHYGEIWYELGGQKAVSRETTVDGVLENIFALAAVTPPQDRSPIFRGHPLAARPVGAPLLFYFLWPALVMSGGFFFQWSKR